jgi:hypothetical protein
MSDGINEFYINLNTIIKDIEKWEINEMYNNISKSMKLDTDFSDIRVRLGDQFNQSYSIENNKSVSRLSVWGIGLVILGTLLTIIGLYLSGIQIYLAEPGGNPAESIYAHFINFSGKYLNFTH